MSYDEQPDPLSDALEAYDKLKKQWAHWKAIAHSLSKAKGGE